MSKDSKKTSAEIAHSIEEVLGEDWLKKGRSRNTNLITLTIGDILIIGGGYNMVTDGEISVFADGSIDMLNGEITTVSQEAVQTAMMQKKTIYNCDEINK